MIILPRRKVLLGAGAGLLASLSTGALRDVREAQAAKLEGVTRLVIFVTGGWFPQECYLGASNTLGPSLEPLRPWADSMTLVEGLQYRAPAAIRRLDDAHYHVGKSELTGGGPSSIDQIVSAKLAAPTVLGSLNLALTPEKNRFIQRNGSTLAGELNPVRVFDQLFAGLAPSATNGPSDRDRRNLLRRQALDHALRAADRLKGQLSGARRAQLEVFAASVAEQRQLVEALSAPPVVACKPPTVDRSTTGLADMNSSLNDDGIYPRTVEAHIRNMTAALLCDSTRVATLQFSNDDNHPKTHFRFVPGITTAYKKNDHDVSHDANEGIAEALRRKRLIHEWYSSKIASLVKTLAGVAEGDGTMLDHTLITWIPAWGIGKAHTLSNVPAVLIGGRKPTGYRHRQYNNQRSVNDFWGGIQQAFGVEQDKFGDVQYSDGAISDLFT